MNKKIVSKWMLASVALVVAFACQSKTPDESNKDDSSSNNSECTSLVTPEATPAKGAVAVQENAVRTVEEPSTYVIEIEDSSKTEEIAPSAQGLTVSEKLSTPDTSTTLNTKTTTMEGDSTTTTTTTTTTP